MKINNMVSNINDYSFYDSYFIQVIEDNLNDIKNRSDSKLIEVNNQLNYKYEGDFYGILEEKNIEKEYHYACLRVNGLSSSSDYKGDKDFITIPNLAYINQLKKISNPRLS